MMLQLTPKQKVTEYVGAYTRPPFLLWGDGRALLGGLYDAFSDFDVTLKDFRVEGTPEDPASQTVRVFIGAVGQYRFRFDRVEATITNGTTEDLSLLPSILGSGASWLREAIEDFSFHSHLFSYGAHCSLAEGTSETILASLKAPELPALGTPRGSGVIFHADDLERAWRLQLTMDHSVLIDNGVFLQLSILIMQDRLDYPAFLAEAERVLRGALASVGLHLEE